MTENNVKDNLYTLYGAHRVDDKRFRFAVYAPKAKSVALVGTFNDWKASKGKMTATEDGYWQIITAARLYDRYKYVITTANDTVIYKADPFAFMSETRGQTNSIVYESDYLWTDNYVQPDLTDKPFNVYELHLGSWKRKPDGSEYGYREIAPFLVNYLKDMHYTHVEFMPLNEYPLDDSWGYQATGYFSPTSRYGTPDDLRFLVESLHNANIGVLLDFVPAHFCKDDFGLAYFDGGCLYESEDIYRREHKDWGTNIFDYGSSYVCSFLLSSAFYWLKEFHFDGLRVDAVASMLYLDYARRNGEWKANIYGGKENLEAIAFLRLLNGRIKEKLPHCITIAEESTAFAGVTASVDKGGLGFTYKWNMGWMNDTLDYVGTAFSNRRNVYNHLTFPMMYAYGERYVLPLSHDEVVHGKRSLIEKQQGTYDQKFDGLATYTAFQYAYAGKKLTFMGNEFAQFVEWRFYCSLDWLLLDYPKHEQYRKLTKQLNGVYASNSALYEKDYLPEGFCFLQANDNSGILSFMRYSEGQKMTCLFNFSDSCRQGYKMPLDRGIYRCIFATKQSFTQTIISDGEISLDLPPLSAAYYLLT